MTRATSIAPSSSSTRSSSSGKDWLARAKLWTEIIETPPGKRVPRDGAVSKEPCSNDLDTI